MIRYICSHPTPLTLTDDFRLLGGRLVSALGLKTQKPNRGPALTCISATSMLLLMTLRFLTHRRSRTFCLQIPLCAPSFFPSSSSFVIYYEIYIFYFGIIAFFSSGQDIRKRFHKYRIKKSKTRFLFGLLFNEAFESSGRCVAYCFS